MEVRKLFKVMLAACLFLMMQGWADISSAQPACTVRDGSMVIELDKKIQASVLDSFVKRYDLTDLKLKESLRSGSYDTLLKKGWRVQVNTPEKLVISKPLLGSSDMADYGKKIVYTQTPAGPVFPRESDRVLYGVNRFSKKYPFEVRNEVVTFYLRGRLQANRVILSGSFNDWNPKGIFMTKTDSGWISQVPLKPGKHWYKFIVDGKWMVDEDNQIRENDGYGNVNSVYFQNNYVFRLNGFSEARKVYLSGSFNNWRTGELLMNRNESGWMLPVYLAQGTHTYKFIVDGTWREDPENPDVLPDGHGGNNSVIALGNPYTFRLPGHTTAKEVFLAGSFNGWRSDELLMNRSANGWTIDYCLRPGCYEYKFVVDGSWITDPDNPNSLDNGEGSRNSFIIVNPNFRFRLKGFDKAKNVYVAGDFNQWNGSSVPMRREGDEWIADVYLSAGKQKYKFVVDGRWITDPANKLFEQNQYGTGNSVVWIPLPNP